MRVRDRFGDYGVVGLIVATFKSCSIQVDTMVVSCRALGKGVERRLVDELVRRARVCGSDRITFAYRPTGRNTLIPAFFAAVGISDGEDGWTLSGERAAVRNNEGGTVGTGPSKTIIAGP